MTESVGYPRFRWFVLLTLVVVTVAQAVIMIGPAPLMGIIAKDLEIGLGKATGMFMGGFNVFLAVSCVAGGVICDRFGFERTFLGSLLLMIVPSLALPSLGHSPQAVLAIRAVQACGAGPVMAVVSQVAATWFPRQERGIVTGLQGSGVALGIAIGFVAGPAGLAAGSWQSAMAWLTVVCFVGLALTIVLFLGPKAPGALEEAVDGAPASAGNGDFKRACRQPVTWVGVGVVFCLCWVLSAFNDLTPAYLAIAPPVGVGYGPMTAGKLMMMFQIAFIVGSAVTGFVMEKVFGGRARPVIMIGFCLFGTLAIAVSSPAITSSLSVLAPWLAVAGFFQAWVVPNAFAFVSLHYPAHITGKLVGMWMGIGLFGGSAGVIAGSVALHHTGNYLVSILLVGAVAFAGLLVSIFLRPPTATSQEPSLQAEY